jgi:hypothetical protein
MVPIAPGDERLHGRPPPFRRGACDRRRPGCDMFVTTVRAPAPGDGCGQRERPFLRAPAVGGNRPSVRRCVVASRIGSACPSRFNGPSSRASVRADEEWSRGIVVDGQLHRHPEPPGRQQRGVGCCSSQRPPGGAAACGVHVERRGQRIE